MKLAGPPRDLKQLRNKIFRILKVTLAGGGVEKGKLRFLLWIGFCRFAKAYPNCV